MPRSWIAINLKDFHDQSKKWQGGDDFKCQMSVIGAKTLEKAKQTAQHGNNNSWIVFNLNSTKNIIYKKDN
jgi:hypothetical protein